MEKYCMVMEIKADRVDDYERMHIDAWPELLETCKGLGVSEEYVFVHGNQMIIFIETEGDVDAYLEAFGKSEVGKKWMKIIDPMIERSSPMLKKIYDMNSWIARQKA